MMWLAIRSRGYWLTSADSSWYFRDQAEKCRDHAAGITNDEARQQLHVLAAKYIMRAVMIESEEPSYMAESRASAHGSR
jgi:hypothetical protein